MPKSKYSLAHILALILSDTRASIARLGEVNKVSGSCTEDCGSPDSRDCMAPTDAELKLWAVCSGPVTVAVSSKAGAGVEITVD